jgi:hypothetical protein
MLLVPQVVEDDPASVGVGRGGVDRRQEPGERGLEGVVLPGVLLDGLPGKGPGHPLRVEGVGQQAAPVDHGVQAVQQVHSVLLGRLARVYPTPTGDRRTASTMGGSGKETTCP